jgi:hypothetical protein
MIFPNAIALDYPVECHILYLAQWDIKFDIKNEILLGVTLGHERSEE